MKKEETFYIGYISKTRGLKGELQIYFDFEDYQELDLDLLFVELNGKLVPFFVAAAKIHENRTGYFFFEDIDHIDKAQALCKKKVYLPLDKKPQRPEGEFYFTDLVGFVAIDEQLGTLGEIAQVMEYPQQYLASVNYNGTELLFPLNDEFIVEIDEQAKTLLLQLPEGLLDIYLDKNTKE